MEKEVEFHFKTEGKNNEKTNITIFNPNTQTEIKIFGADEEKVSKFHKNFDYRKIFAERGAESVIETYFTGIFSGKEDFFDKTEYNVTKIDELNQKIASLALNRSREFRIFIFDENLRKTFIFKKVIQNEKFDEFSTDRISSATEEFDNNNYISIEFDKSEPRYKIETNVKEQEKKKQEELEKYIKYNPDNLFKDKKETSKTIEKTRSKEVDLVEYNESLLKKIWNKIISIFKK